MISRYYMIGFLVFTVILRLGCCQCLSGWQRYNTKCYFFSNEHLDWVESNDLCKLLSAKLAEPMDTPEVNFIRGHAEKLHNKFWLGINDISVEKRWVYTSSNLPITVTNWGPHDPNGNQASNCVATWNDNSYHSAWADAPCTEKFGAVCERSAELTDVIG